MCPITYKTRASQRKTSWDLWDLNLLLAKLTLHKSASALPASHRHSSSLKIVKTPKRISSCDQMLLHSIIRRSMPSISAQSAPQESKLLTKTQILTPAYIFNQIFTEFWPISSKKHCKTCTNPRKWQEVKQANLRPNSRWKSTGLQ